MLNIQNKGVRTRFKDINLKLSASVGFPHTRSMTLQVMIYKDIVVIDPTLNLYILFLVVLPRLKKFVVAKLKLSKYDGGLRILCYFRSFLEIVHK